MRRTGPDGSYHAPMPGPRRVVVALAALVALGSIVGAYVASAGSGPAAYSAQDGAVRGPLSAMGGPYLTDRAGRVVFLHGVNAVYKRAPYELYADPGKGWSFTRADAARMASLGFNVVRLGVIWQGLEPGTLGPNSPEICSPGTPGNPHQFDAPGGLDLSGQGGPDRRPAGPVPYLHAPRHARGRLQLRVRGRGGTVLGGLQRRPPHRHASRSLVEHVQRSGADRLGPPLLDQRRGRRPPGRVHPLVEGGGRLLQRQPVGGGFRPHQRTLHQDPPGGHPRGGGPTGVPVHGDVRPGPERHRRQRPHLPAR